MLLSGDEIRNRGLIQNALADGYRAASYDVHVGRIFPVSGDERNSFVLKPQGTVLVISRERIQLPKNVAGYATVRTRLCQDGILAINIGIIDSEYQGLVSSYLINFGKSDFALSADQPFLRLGFHEFTPSKNPPPAQTVSDNEYVRARKGEAVAFMSETFLDLEGTIKKVADKILDEWKNGLIKWAALAGVTITLLAFGVTLGVTYSGREVPSKEQLKAELTREIVDETKQQLKAEGLRDFEDRIKKLEQEVREAKQKASAQQGAASGPSKP